AATDRTLKVRSVQQMKLQDRNRPGLALVDTIDYDILETIQPEPRGAKVRLLFGRCTGLVEDTGTPNAPPYPRRTEAAQLLKRMFATFIVDPAGSMKEVTVSNMKANMPIIEDDLSGMYSRATNSYESVLVLLPNRTVNAQETWRARPRMLLGAKGAKTKEPID